MRRTNPYCIGLFFIFTLCGSLLITGCRKEIAPDFMEAFNNTAEAVSAVPVSFTMLYSDNASYGYDPNWPILQEMTRLTNVTLDIEAVPESDYNTKRRIVLSSGVIHDIVSKTKAGTVGEYIASGEILPISRYAEDMPHFVRFIEENDLGQELASVTEEDGNYYSLPVKCFTERFQEQVWTYRKDILDKHGLIVPETFEELYEVSRELKRLYPDSYPLTNRFGTGNLLGTVAPSFGTNAGWGLGNSGFIYDGGLHEWIFAPATEEFKSLLIWLNRMLNEGLLDPEFTTLESNIYESRIISGQTFFMADWLGNEIRYHKKGRVDNPDFTVAPMMPPAGPYGDRKIRSAGYAPQGWVIPSRAADEEDFDTLLRYLDWFYSEEGTNLFAWGIEDLTFTYDEKGSKKYIDEILNGELDASKDFGFLNNCLTVVYPFDAYLALQNEDSRSIINRMALEDTVPAPDPKLRYTLDERKRVYQIQAGLESYYERMILEFIYGDVSFDHWDEYLDQCYRKGSGIIKEMIDAVWYRQNN